MREWLKEQIRGLWKPGVLAMACAIGLMLVAGFVWYWPDGRLHLIVCDVGQGDAILVIRGNWQMLVDGGPDNKVLGCLSRHMPFWDKTLEVVALTHPEADHLNGIFSVLKSYNVMYFVSIPVGNQTEGFKALLASIAEKVTSQKLVVRNLYRGDEVAGGNFRILTLWPDRGFVNENLSADNSKIKPTDWLKLSDNTRMTGLQDNSHKSLRAVDFGGGNVLGETTTKETNNFSMVFKIKYGNFGALLTGDFPGSLDGELTKDRFVEQIDVLKVAHHGSRTGTTEQLLEDIRPKLGMISVGRGNSYGQPHTEVLTMFGNLGIPIKRTDLDGEIEVVSDGEKWWTIK